MTACKQRANSSDTAANTSDGLAPRATRVATRRSAAWCSARTPSSSWLTWTSRRRRSASRARNRASPASVAADSATRRKTPTATESETVAARMLPPVCRRWNNTYTAALASVVSAPSRNPHTVETARMPRRKTTPKTFPPVTRMSRYTKPVSAARSRGATIRPRASGGAVGRSNNRNARARIDVVGGCGREAPWSGPFCWAGLRRSKSPTGFSTARDGIKSAWPKTNLRCWRRAQRKRPSR